MESQQCSESGISAVRVLVEKPCQWAVCNSLHIHHNVFSPEYYLLFGGHRTNPLGFWTARDCDLVYRNTTHVHCQCSQFGTFGVLMDSSHREVTSACRAVGSSGGLLATRICNRLCGARTEFESFLCLPVTLPLAFVSLLLQQLEGDLETLAIVTYSLVSLSLVALLLTFSFLTCLKGLKSNTRGIHSNISVTLFFSELLFLLGINHTENQVCGLHTMGLGGGVAGAVSGGTVSEWFLFPQFLCTVIAILLHCFFLSTFAWLFVQGLHIYRMQTEARNVNFGAMRFYYAIGWGVPAIITGRSCLSRGHAKNISSQQPPEPLVSPWWGVRPQPAIWVVCVVLKEGVQVGRGGGLCCAAENMCHRLF